MLTTAFLLSLMSQGFSVSFVPDTEPESEVAYYFNELDGQTRECMKPIRQDGKTLTICDAGSKQYVIFVRDSK